jgi:hypothetical protein
VARSTWPSSVALKASPRRLASVDVPCGRAATRRRDPTVAAILSLQGSAGNSAVLQALAAGRAASGNLLQRDSSTVTFADPDIQSVYDVNTAGLSVSEAQQSGLGVLSEQYKTIGSAWSKLN